MVDNHFILDGQAQKKDKPINHGQEGDSSFVTP